jgi:hypothetical protein
LNARTKLEDFLDQVRSHVTTFCTLLILYRRKM